MTPAVDPNPGFLRASFGRLVKSSINETEHKKGGENGIRHWSFGCDSFSACDYAFSLANRA